MSTEPKASAGGGLGSSVPRLEDGPLVSGRGRFIGDISFPHQLHMRVVRSPYAHAVLRGVDISAAVTAPGVVSVWTAADIADLPPIDFRDPTNEVLRPYRQPLLARDRLRYVGEPAAAVFATDAYLAEDAADLVTIEADELQPVLDAMATFTNEPSWVAPPVRTPLGNFRLSALTAPCRTPTAPRLPIPPTLTLFHQSCRTMERATTGSV